MGYKDWMPEFQDEWDEIPVNLSSFSKEDVEWAEYLYELGFMTYHGEEPSKDTQEARELFFKLLGIDA